MPLTPQLDEEDRLVEVEVEVEIDHDEESYVEAEAEAEIGGWWFIHERFANLHFVLHRWDAVMAVPTVATMSSLYLSCGFLIL